MKLNKVLCYISFDIFGVDQLDALCSIKEKCAHLTVFIEDNENTKTIVPTSERCEIVSALKCVDNCLCSNNASKLELDESLFDKIYRI